MQDGCKLFITLQANIEHTIQESIKKQFVAFE